VIIISYGYGNLTKAKLVVRRGRKATDLF